MATTVGFIPKATAPIATPDIPPKKDEKTEDKTKDKS